MPDAEFPRIAIDAPIRYGKSGGVGQAILGLLRALGQLADGGELYTVVVESGDTMDWLRAYAGKNQRFVVKPRSFLQRVRRLAERTWNAAWPSSRHRAPVSNGFYESLGCQVLHFPHQKFIRTELATIYNPHDLLHVHYPEHFTRPAIAWREAVYSEACRAAHTVVVASNWVKNDCVQHFGLNPDKVQIIPWGPPTQAYAEPTSDHMETLKLKYDLKQPFALYPAMTWPHKNHLGLLEALALLRDRDQLRVRLVCTGTIFEPFRPQIERRLDRLNLRSQVSFLGFVPEEDLRAVYRLCQFMVMPTLFESDSFPIYEAWSEGVPVTCSDVTSLPDQVRDAALLFDPHQVASISNAVRAMAGDEALRNRLRERGFERVKVFDWQKTAKAYRAVYRRAAGRVLSDEERWLLSWDWMRQPQPDVEVRT